MKRSHAVLAASALAFACSCRPAVEPPAPEATPFTPVALGDRPGVHNVYQLSPKLYSGSSPEGDAGFQSLRELGIVTIVSVDGVTPDIETAKRHGLRYLHLPVGYDGVPRETALRIARVVRDSPGPVFVHCHHGKHRGPASAIAAVRCLDDRCDVRAAYDFLAAAGTDPRYKGLFADVERITPASPTELDRAATLPEVAVVPALTQLMVGIDERWDKLKAAKASGWLPDAGAAHEAVQLIEGYREAARLPVLTAVLRKEFGEAERVAGELDAGIRAKDRDRTEAAFRAAAASCTRCHSTHRDQADRNDR